MKIVSEQSEQDIAVRRAEKNLGFAIRELTANLMRVTRGAGKPDEISSNVNDLFIAIEEYQNASDYGVPPHVYANALQLPNPRNNNNIDLGYAENQMLKGALQIVASTFKQQNPQISAGKSELIDGVHQWEQAIEDLNNPEKPTELNIKWSKE